MGCLEAVVDIRGRIPTSALTTRKCEMPTSRAEAVKRPLKEFPEWTSTHGIPQVGRSKAAYCIGFWSLITVVALGILIWQTIVIILNYTSFGVSVQIELQFQQRPFPAVTFCNLNPYKWSVVQTFSNVRRLTDTYEYAMYKISCQSDDRCTFQPNATLQSDIEMYGFDNVTDSAALQSRAKRLLSLEMANYDASTTVDTIDDFLQGCSFNAADCNSTTDFISFVDPVMGSCFTYNKDASHITSRAGPIYGLRMILKTNVSEFIPTSDAAGMRIVIHDQNEWPFPDIFGYQVMVGTSTRIGVTYQSMSRLPSPYGDCTDIKPPSYLYENAYSTEGCQRSRYQWDMISNCSCYDPSYAVPNDTSVGVCQIPSDFDCYDLITNESTADNSCTQPCTEGVYQVTVSSAKWPSGSISSVGDCYEGEYGNESCIQVYEDNGAMVEIYYEKLNYETMDESPAYTLVNMLSDFGGQIGLWLGMSVVSIIEICVLFFQIVFACLSPSLGQRVVHEQ